MTKTKFKTMLMLIPYSRPTAVAGVNGMPQPPGQNHLVELIKAAAYRKQHPCFYIDFTKWKKKASCGCVCGSIYGCEIHGECAITHNQSCQVQSCVFCGSYTERVSTPMDRRPLIIPVGITTCPIIRCALRDGTQTCDKRSCSCGGVAVGYRYTLPRTLKSIEQAGWNRSDVTIFGEPESAVDPSVIEAAIGGWTVTYNSTVRLGPWSNLYASLRRQRAAHPNADCYLMMEDDTWLSRNALKEIERRGLPPDSQWGIVRMFRMSWRKGGKSDIFCQPKRTDGYQPLRPGQYLWGTNAVLFSPLALDRMLADRIDGTYEDSPDLKIGLLMAHYGFSEWTCNPSLAQTDTSKPSAVGHGTSDLMQSDTFIEDAREVERMYA